MKARPTKIPVRIRVSETTYWWLVDRARDLFNGDIDATIIDLLQRAETQSEDTR